MLLNFSIEAFVKEGNIWKIRILITDEVFIFKIFNIIIG